MEVHSRQAPGCSCFGFILPDRRFRGHSCGHKFSQGLPSTNVDAEGVTPEGAFRVGGSGIPQASTQRHAVKSLGVIPDGSLRACEHGLLLHASAQARAVKSLSVAPEGALKVGEHGILSRASTEMHAEEYCAGEHIRSHVRSLPVGIQPFVIPMSMEVLQVRSQRCKLTLASA